jgi:riboflavin synthase
MFTGIIQATGRIRARRDVGGDVRLEIGSAGLDFGDVSRGDSIAVNGVCLTAVEVGPDWFAADCSRETLGLTSLGSLENRATVNLEKALVAGQPLGGHLVSGHVDGLGRCVLRTPEARSVRFEFEVPRGLSRYIARKGSICVDGVSLTINAVEGNRFGVNIVPHTLEATNIGGYVAGTVVNIEVDVIARYLEQLLRTREEDGIDLDKLKLHGFAAD